MKLSNYHFHFDYFDLFLKKIQSKNDDQGIYTLDVLAIAYIDIVFKHIRKVASPASTKMMASMS